jgi:hypothetical protein
VRGKLIRKIQIKCFEYARSCRHILAPLVI